MELVRCSLVLQMSKYFIDDNGVFNIRDDLHRATTLCTHFEQQAQETTSAITIWWIKYFFRPHGITVLISNHDTAFTRSAYQHAKEQKALRVT